MKRQDVTSWAMSSKLRGQLTKGPELAAAFKEQGGGSVRVRAGRNQGNELQRARRRLWGPRGSWTELPSDMEQGWGKIRNGSGHGLWAIHVH